MRWIALTVILLATLAHAEMDVLLNPSDFFVYPPTYKAIVPWWCAPDTVYSKCQACVAVRGPSRTGQGPQTPGVCQNGSSNFNLDLNLPSVPYQHCAGTGECAPGEGSFCVSVADSFTTDMGGGGGAYGGCWLATPLPAFVAEIADVSWGAQITKRWHAHERHHRWKCHGDCNMFVPFRPHRPQVHR